MTKLCRVVLLSGFWIPASDRPVLLQSLVASRLNSDTFLFRNSKLLTGERKNHMTNPAGHTSWKLATALIAVLIAATQADTAQAESEFDGKESKWNGFVRHDFKTAERACIVVSPEKAADGKPWIWRARFFGHEPQADVEMLKRGYHIAYCDVGNLFGNPQAVKHWDDFYEFLTSKHGFAKKVAL